MKGLKRTEKKADLLRHSFTGSEDEVGGCSNYGAIVGGGADSSALVVRRKCCGSAGEDAKKSCYTILLSMLGIVRDLGFIFVLPLAEAAILVLNVFVQHVGAERFNQEPQDFVSDIIPGLALSTFAVTVLVGIADLATFVGKSPLLSKIIQRLACLIVSCGIMTMFILAATEYVAAEDAVEAMSMSRGLKDMIPYGTGVFGALLYLSREYRELSLKVDDALAGVGNSSICGRSANCIKNLFEKLRRTGVFLFGLFGGGIAWILVEGFLHAKVAQQGLVLVGCSSAVGWLAGGVSGLGQALARTAPFDVKGVIYPAIGESLAAYPRAKKIAMWECGSCHAKEILLRAMQKITAVFSFFLGPSLAALLLNLAPVPTAYVEGFIATYGLMALMLEKYCCALAFMPGNGTVLSGLCGDVVSNYSSMLCDSNGTDIDVGQLYDNSSATLQIVAMVFGITYSALYLAEGVRKHNYADPFFKDGSCGTVCSLFRNIDCGRRSKREEVGGIRLSQTNQNGNAE